MRENTDQNNSECGGHFLRSVTHFTIPFRLKNLTYLTNLNLLNIIKNIFPQHSQNPTHFTNFLANMFLVGVSKNIRTASFLDAQQLHSRSTGELNVYVFLYASVRSIYLVAGWVTSFRKLVVWAS